MWRSSSVACIATKQMGHDFGALDGGSSMPIYNCQHHRPINYGGSPNAETIPSGAVYDGSYIKQTSAIDETH